MSRIAPSLRHLAKPAAMPRLAASMTSTTTSTTTSRVAVRASPLASRQFHTSPARRNPPSGEVMSEFTPPPTATRAHVLPEFNLRGKVVVVSGGARGLGLLQAEALLEAGATVHVIDRLPDPGLDASSGFTEVAKRARTELESSLTYHQCDVRDNAELNRIFEDIADRSGRLDGLVAAAGINQEVPALNHTAEDSDRIMSINVTGCFMTAQAAARQMVRLKQPGSICMIASMSGTIANKGLFCPAYNASKAAVLQLSRNLAAEWGVHNIRCNTISPGYIDTKMLQSLFDDYPERKTTWPKENMLGRFSQPHEYRGAAVFLLSDASSFMTGADLRMDGGHAAW